MFTPTENQEKLADYLKQKDFEKEMKLGILLCCETDEQAKKCLNFVWLIQNLKIMNIWKKR